MVEPHPDPLLIRFDVTADMGCVIYGFLPRFAAANLFSFSLGGGTNMINEGDPEDLSHVMGASMR